MHRKHSKVWFVFIKYSAAYENLNWENNGGNTFCAFPAAVPQGAPHPALRAPIGLQHVCVGSIHSSALDNACGAENLMSLPYILFSWHPLGALQLGNVPVGCAARSLQQNAAEGLLLSLLSHSAFGLASIVQ